MDLGTMIVIGGMISFSLWAIFMSTLRIFETWTSGASIGTSFLATVGWIFVAGIFVAVLFEMYEGFNGKD